MKPLILRLLTVVLGLLLILLGGIYSFIESDSIKISSPYFLFHVRESTYGIVTVLIGLIFMIASFTKWNLFPFQILESIDNQLRGKNNRKKNGYKIWKIIFYSVALTITVILAVIAAHYVNTK